MRKIFQYLILISLIVTVFGCSSSDDEDVLSQPAPLVEFKPTLKLEKIWEVGTSASVSNLFSRLQPVIAYDKVFVAGTDGIVEALSLESGKKIWSIETGATIQAGVSAGSEMVVVGTRNGEVIAIDQETGKELWRNLLSSEILSPAAIGEGFVVVRTEDGKLFGLDEKTGIRKWFFDRNVPILTLRGSSTPIITRGVVISGFDNGKVALFLLSNGKPIWEKRIAQSTGRSELERIVDMDAKPLVVEDTLYAVTYNGNIASIDIRSGQVVWQRDMSSFNNIDTDGLRLYVSTADDEIKALSTKNGATFWNQNQLKNRKLTSPVVAGDYVVVGDYEGYLHWMNAKNGDFVARKHFTSSGISGNPVVKGNRMAVQGKNGDVLLMKVPEATYQ